MTAGPSRHAKEYWVAKQAAAAAKLAQDMRLLPEEAAAELDDLEVTRGARGLVLLQVAKLLLVAEQLDRRAQELKP